MDFLPDEIDQLVREYFRGEETLCFACGGDVKCALETDSSGTPQLMGRCLGCQKVFEWRQNTAIGKWRRIHLNYFLECRRKGLPPRCPIDDSTVFYMEYSDGLLEFRCPYCNRRGSIEAPAGRLE